MITALGLSVPLSCTTCVTVLFYDGRYSMQIRERKDTHYSRPIDCIALLAKGDRTKGGKR